MLFRDSFQEQITMPIFCGRIEHKKWRPQDKPVSQKVSVHVFAFMNKKENMKMEDGRRRRRRRKLAYQGL